MQEGCSTRICHGGARAFYAPSEDRIQLPERSAFASAPDYCRVALHELTHWNGHPSRCNRVLSSRATIEACAFEELVAEMGSAFLTSYIETRCKMDAEKGTPPQGRG